MRTLKFAIDKLLDYDDPGDTPNYSIPEVARYLDIPPATLRSWVCGRTYPITGGTKFFEPVIRLPDWTEGTSPLLSFINLVEVHVLNAIRRKYNIDLEDIRRAIDFLTQRLPSRHPLIEAEFETDGKALFVRELGTLIVASEDGQMAMQVILDAHLKRIDRDETGAVRRLYPFLCRNTVDGPRNIFIDPNVSFGRPILAGSGVSTTVLANRYKAGDRDIAVLARDYGIDPARVTEAIDWELRSKAA